MNASFFSNLFWKIGKWTFINVHFLKKSFRFEKNIDFVTQSIMLTITFLSLKFCYDNFFLFFGHFWKAAANPADLLMSTNKKMPKNARKYYIKNMLPNMLTNDGICVLGFVTIAHFTNYY